MLRLQKEMDLSQFTGGIIAVPVLNILGFQSIQDVNPLDSLEILGNGHGEGQFFLTWGRHFCKLNSLLKQVIIRSLSLI